MRLLRTLNLNLKSNRSIRIGNLCLLALVLVPLAATERLPASFSRKIVRMSVEIDGVKYGAFSPVKDIDQLSSSSKGTDASRVTLSRDFVTDPSLYLWANSLMRGNTGLKDIVLLSENADGVEISRHILHKSQPVAWTVETSNPEVGGLHERVEFAVQRIEHKR